MFAIACLLQVFFIVKRVHNYPFMIFDMYSRPETPVDRSSQYLIIADRDTVYTSTFPILAEGRLIRTLDIYRHYQVNGVDYWDPALSSRQDRWLGQHTPGKWLYRRSDRLLRQDPAAMDEVPGWLHGILEQHLHRPVDTVAVVQVVYDRRLDKVTRASEILKYVSER